MNRIVWMSFMDEFIKLGGIGLPKITPPPTIPPKGFTPATSNLIQQSPIPTPPPQQIYQGMNKVPIAKNVGVRPGLLEGGLE
jgi:hypothetical protein